MVWSYLGVRALYDDGASAAQAATRDYVLELNDAGGAPLPLLGGKITTYRHLALLDALDKLSPHLGAAAARRGDWTGARHCPAAISAAARRRSWRSPFRQNWPWLAPPDAAPAGPHLRHQGRDVSRGGGRRSRRADHLRGGPPTVAEVRHLMREEFARTAADVLWRRTKLGLRLTSAEVGAGRLHGVGAQRCFA